MTSGLRCSVNNHCFPVVLHHLSNYHRNLEYKIPCNKSIQNPKRDRGEADVNMDKTPVGFHQRAACKQCAGGLKELVGLVQDYEVSRAVVPQPYQIGRSPDAVINGRFESHTEPRLTGLLAFYGKECSAHCYCTCRLAVNTGFVCPSACKTVKSLTHHHRLSSTLLSLFADDSILWVWGISISWNISQR